MKYMQIRIDDELKEEFTEVCKELGITYSTAVRMFAKKVVKDKALPFTLSIEDK